MPDYKLALDSDPKWSLQEGSRHFEGKSTVFEAMHKVCLRLGELRICHAVVGEMAIFRHGLRRFTEVITILVTKDDLNRIHAKLEGLGYLPPHRHSKHLRDTELGVRIEFLTTGDYPGDGKEKPVVFPDPRDVSFESDGVHYIQLPSLIELKLASGMSGAGRLKDLSDVLELIKLLNLPQDFAEQLNPYVREKFVELWKQATRRYVALWRNKWLTANAKTLAEMSASLHEAARLLEAMRMDGVTLEDDNGIGDDYARLVTTDPKIAQKYDMLEESELWDSRDDGGEIHDANDAK